MDQQALLLRYDLGEGFAPLAGTDRSDGERGVLGVLNADEWRDAATRLCAVLRPALDDPRAHLNASSARASSSRFFPGPSR